MKGGIIMVQFIINRLKEATTYAGLFTILGVAGVAISPEQKEAIITVCTAIVGAILVFFPNVIGEKK
jgi:hypothetical protein